MVITTKKEYNFLHPKLYDLINKNMEHVYKNIFTTEKSRDDVTEEKYEHIIINDFLKNGYSVIHEKISYNKNFIEDNGVEKINR